MEPTLRERIALYVTRELPAAGEGFAPTRRRQVEISWGQCERGENDGELHRSGGARSRGRTVGGALPRRPGDHPRSGALAAPWQAPGGGPGVGRRRHVRFRAAASRPHTAEPGSPRAGVQRSTSACQRRLTPAWEHAPRARLSDHVPDFPTPTPDFSTACPTARTPSPPAAPPMLGGCSLRGGSPGLCRRPASRDPAATGGGRIPITAPGTGVRHPSRRGRTRNWWSTRPAGRQLGSGPRFLPRCARSARTSASACAMATVRNADSGSAPRAPAA